MALKPNTPYAFTTSVGRVYQPITLQDGESWLTLRDDGTFQLSAGPSTPKIAHVLVQDLTGAPFPNVRVNVIPVAGGPLVGDALTGADGIVNFDVESTTPPPPPPNNTLLYVGIGAAVVVGIGLVLWKVG